MADYIDRKTALSFPFANEQYDHENANENFIFGCETYKEWLENLPIADVQEVRHGEWIKLNKSYNVTEVYECSLCGRHLYMDKNTPKEFVLKVAPYCHCGAKMGGKENNK